MDKLKIHYVEKFSEGAADEQLEAMRTYFDLVPPDECDFIYLASILHVQKAQSLKATYHKPLAVYCWDYYLWAHDGRHKGYDWMSYKLLLLLADVVFVPSQAQQLRLKELLFVDSIVVPSGVRRFTNTPRDDGYILDPVRYYEHDPNCYWMRDAAEKLGIPFKHPEHGVKSEEEWRELIAGATFLTCGYVEASTGGLSLPEGMWLGKASLVSNSPYMGARDYLGQLGFYFQYDDFNELVDKMGAMWRRRVKVPIKSARAWMDKELSFDVMARRLHDALQLKKKEIAL